MLLLYAGRPEPTPDPFRIEVWADYVSPGDAAPRGVLFIVRTLIVRSGPDQHQLENFYTEPGGTERMFLRYVYRRQA